jgi:hypothetical protein
MRPGLRLAEALICTTLIVACTTHPGSSREETSTPPATTRLLAGEPMTACTIEGDYPVQAETPGLCGTLEVPEDRSNPDGRQIGLRVAVVPAATADRDRSRSSCLLAGRARRTQFFAWLPGV